MEVQQVGVRILIINSCGKSKAIEHPDQPSCTDLQTDEDRRKVRHAFQNISKPARELYTGQQATMVAQAVALLKQKYQVDYYIISAGFGLVHEDEMLPPYDCTFARKSRRAIRRMADALSIDRDIRNLASGYDLVYLALGRNYLKSFDLITLENKGREIIHFDKSADKRKPFVCIDDQLILGKSDEISVFIHKPGGLVSTKGGILLNYAEYISVHSFIAFNDWWSLVRTELSDNRSLLTTSHNVKIDTGIKNKIYSFDQRDRRTDYLPTDRAMKEADKIVSKLTKDQIALIQQLSEGLNPPQRKSTLETYGDWVDPYRDYSDDLEKIETFVEDAIQLIQDRTEENKTESRKAVADAIRERQVEQGFDKYLCNPVKLSLFSTVLKYLDDPKKLKEQLPEKKRRSKKSGKKSGQPLNYEIRIRDAGESNGKLQINGSLINKENYPLQNLKISIFDSEGNPIMANQVFGRMFEVASGNIHIPFLSASMADSNHTEQFRIVLDSWVDLDAGFSLSCSVDNPSTGDVDTKEFRFPTEE